MGQDNVTGAKCASLCGYDDGKAIWFGKDREGDHHAALCSKCRKKLVYKFFEYFGANCSSDDYALGLEWDAVDAILGAFERDIASRHSVYKVSDKKRYERLRRK